METRELEEGTERWDRNDFLHQGPSKSHFTAELDGLPLEKAEFNKIEEKRAAMGSSTTENRVPSIPGRPTDEVDVPSPQQRRDENTSEVPWKPNPSYVELDIRHMHLTNDEDVEKALNFIKKKKGGPGFYCGN